MLKVVAYLIFKLTMQYLNFYFLMLIFLKLGSHQIMVVFVMVTFWKMINHIVY